MSEFSPPQQALGQALGTIITPQMERDLAVMDFISECRALGVFRVQALLPAFDVTAEMISEEPEVYGWDERTLSFGLLHAAKGLVEVRLDTADSGAEDLAGLTVNFGSTAPNSPLLRHFIIPGQRAVVDHSGLGFQDTAEGLAQLEDVQAYWGNVTVNGIPVFPESLH